jgi:hypothetical protein
MRDLKATCRALGLVALTAPACGPDGPQTDGGTSTTRARPMHRMQSGQRLTETSPVDDDTDFWRRDVQ